MTGSPNRRVAGHDRRVPLTHRRLVASVLIVGTAVLLAGCARHGNGLPEDYGQDWFGKMASQHGGDHGGGGGQLMVDDEDETRARAFIVLDTELAGSYDVLAVCRSTKTVHLTVHDFTSEHDGYGDSADPDSLIGAADLHCGTTTRTPIDVPEGRDGIVLDATTSDTSERSLFDAFIVERGADE